MVEGLSNGESLIPQLATSETLYAAVRQPTDLEKILASLDEKTRLMRLPEVMHKVGLGRTSIYERIRMGSFPRPLQLGGNSVAWINKDIDAWIAEKIINSSKGMRS